MTKWEQLFQGLFDFSEDYTWLSVKNSRLTVKVLNKFSISILNILGRTGYFRIDPMDMKNFSYIKFTVDSKSE